MLIITTYFNGWRFYIFVQKSNFIIDHNALLDIQRNMTIW